MTEQGKKHATREELKGNLPGKLRGYGDGEQRKLKEYPDLCEPENYPDACKKISNPGIDGLEGVYKKRSQQS